MWNAGCTTPDMTALDELIPTPRLLETDRVELDAAPNIVWEYVRHAELADSPWIRALFSIRTLPSRLWGANEQATSHHSLLRIDDIRSTAKQPGFQLLLEEPGRSVCIGAIGQVWQPDIPFRHVGDAQAYVAFAEPDWIKVAWQIRVTPHGSGTLLELEVRVDATSDDAWTKFSRYWTVVGPGSHFIRSVLLSGIRRRFGATSPAGHRHVPGDELLPDAQGESTQELVIDAPAANIWPWLVQMGCRRGGFYAIDVLDNGGRPSAREIHPELQNLRVGEVIAATPDGVEGFEVLKVETERALVLGSLFDVSTPRQLPFGSTRPNQYWHVTWAFALEPEGPTRTRLTARARAAFSPSETVHVAWIRPVHTLMQLSQLRHLAQRAEGTLPRDSLLDVGEGLVGAAIILAATVTPFLRRERNHWGLTEAEAAAVRPGDEFISQPRWSWTHAVDLDAPPAAVWPWVSQLGADRAGFYSYQWLENLAGCNLRNAESIHAEWEHRVGDTLVLHPKMPPIPIVAVEPERHLIAYAPPDAAAQAAGLAWAAASWAFILEPLEGQRCRLVSRFRSSCSDDLVSRLTQGPTLLEPIGFAMDRRMLLGIKERVAASRSRQ